MKSLESTLDESIAREEQALQREEVPIDPANADIAVLQRTLRESHVKYEAGSGDIVASNLVLTDVQSELERLRKKMSEAEQRSNRTILEVWWQTVEIVVTYFSRSSAKRSVTSRVWSKLKYVDNEYHPHMRLTTLRRSTERSAGCCLGLSALLTRLDSRMTSSEKLNDSEGSCLVPSPRDLQRRTVQKKKSNRKGKRGPRYLQSRPQLRQKVRHRTPFVRSVNSQAMISSPVLFSRMMTALLRSRMLRAPKSIVKIANLIAIQVSAVFPCPLMALMRVIAANCPHSLDVF